MDRQHSNRPEMRWIHVVDASGRSRMEARWIVPAEAEASNDAA